MNATVPSSIACSEMSDEALLLAYRADSDRQAVSELIRRYERPLYAYLARYTGDRSLAEELFQTTFQRVIERADQFSTDRKFRPWLYSIATHLAIDAGRRSGRRRALLETTHQDDHAHPLTVLDLLVDREPPPSARLETDERRRIVHAAVDRLQEPLRRVVMLVYFQGLTLREVAEALELPLGTVKSRLHKALVALHDHCNRLAGANAA